MSVIVSTVKLYLFVYPAVFWRNAAAYDFAVFTEVTLTKHGRAGPLTAASAALPLPAEVGRHQSGIPSHLNLQHRREGLGVLCHPANVQLLGENRRVIVLILDFNKHFGRVS